MLPQKLEVINIGDVSKTTCKWKIGKVLRFIYHSGKITKEKQCKQVSIKFPVI